MKCKDIMTKHLMSCTLECSAKDAAHIMKEIDAGVVPVVNASNQLSGILTDRDITIYTVAEGKRPETVNVQEFMTKSVITVYPDEDIDVAIRKMEEYKIRRIPVVDDENRLLGIISLGDIALQAHKEHETFEILEKVSEHLS